MYKYNTVFLTPFARAVLTKSELKTLSIEPRTTCNIRPKGLINKTDIGNIQCQRVPVPDVGNHPKFTEKITIATMATQKSGALAPISEKNVAILSKKPPTLNAAIEPIKMAETATIDIVITS